jgi:threonine dehydrogenase-like Zn-dependent dehydrogenase
MAARIAHHHGFRVIAVDRVPERLERAASRGIQTLDMTQVNGSVGDAVRSLTDGRGTDSVIDAVGMEAHGSRIAQAAQTVTAFLPDAIATPEWTGSTPCTRRSTVSAGAARCR